MKIETSDVEIYKLSNEQKAAIEEAESQIRNGEALTDEEASKEIEEWLSLAFKSAARSKKHF